MADATPAGSGGPIRVSPPAPDGILTISGGVGGITVQLEELDVGAGKVDALADRLAAIEKELFGAWQGLGSYQNHPRSTGTAALIAVGEARDACQRVRLELQRISGQVRGCRRDYEAAEQLKRILGLPDPRSELQKHGDFWRTGFLNGDATERLVAHGVTILPVARPAVEEVFSSLRTGPVKAKQEESIAINLDATPAGLLERVRLLEERGSGFIEVIEVADKGGQAYVVVVPGTQVKEADAGTNPFDLGGILDGMGNNSAQVNAAVLQALQAAGAEPGADVVAVGYSQGGIHAMNLAADKEFSRNYDMKYVLTAGSPISRIIPPDDVSTLHLEHRTDWVPGSDGSANPDTRNQVTVTVTNDLYVRGGEDAGLGPGHRLSGYEEAGRLVAASKDPSLVHSTAALGAVLGAGGAATATRFSLTKAPPPPPPMDGRDPFSGRRQLSAR
ncbi:WXG100 family type VII secretion target [Paenarthrobacter sp. 22069]|uniref:WXG100 family type VII secretion target n=1 Tax=Paenarthrobacter sp. 22069 TaxID=3453864 RepID=UPI003F82C7C6